MGLFDKLKRKKKAVPQETSADVKVDEKVEKAKEVVKTQEKAPAAKVSGAINVFHNVLLRPVVTEKSLAMQTHNKYSFFVARDANKYKVKMAIKEIYGVAPSQVRIVNKQATVLKRWGRKRGIRKGSKKAIVTMPKGTSLSIID